MWNDQPQDTNIVLHQIDLIAEDECVLAADAAGAVKCCDFRPWPQGTKRWCHQACEAVLWKLDVTKYVTMIQHGSVEHGISGSKIIWEWKAIRIRQEIRGEALRNHRNPKTTSKCHQMHQMNQMNQSYQVSQTHMFPTSICGVAGSIRRSPSSRGVNHVVVPYTVPGQWQCKTVGGCFAGEVHPFRVVFITIGEPYIG